ncbi:MAG TPA: ABC transporter ATP-binding protein [Candidatus Aerophobetes bacterium]|uniref:ABC transporter ATP-binding protein n=1 Tax=Aerophobetes bacterium TaxID=2030807 RepID=A0A662DIH3_UNCAE|nr:MAG: branched-chain amino acid ABC transporter ATP-binding protein [Candidatus Aerophobetes bacterium]HDN84715.1 ABC transporter ATP-binding protein [Candidatus Aerophobetes bacterium]
MLKVRNLKSFYGYLQALRGVSIHVEEGEIVALIGANGAGKTTLLNSIAGIISSKKGQILFKDKDITHFPPQQIVKQGISLVPEGRQLFTPLSVMDNLILGAYQRYKRKNKDNIEADLDRVFHFFPILRERRKQLAGTLSGGEQQMLAIARALMSKPKLLLLDEPSMGLAPKVVKEIFRIILELQKEGTTIFLVEQNAKMALGIANRGYVIETGRIVIQGSSQELLGNKEIRRAYLGRGYKKVWE